MKRCLKCGRRYKNWEDYCGRTWKCSQCGFELFDALYIGGDSVWGGRYSYFSPLLLDKKWIDVPKGCLLIVNKVKW